MLARAAASLTVLALFGCGAELSDPGAITADADWSADANELARVGDVPIQQFVGYLDKAGPSARITIPIAAPAIHFIAAYGMHETQVNGARMEKVDLRFFGCSVRVEPTGSAATEVIVQCDPARLPYGYTLAEGSPVALAVVETRTKRGLHIARSSEFALTQTTWGLMANIDIPVPVQKVGSFRVRRAMETTLASAQQPFEDLVAYGCNVMIASGTHQLGATASVRCRDIDRPTNMTLNPGDLLELRAIVGVEFGDHVPHEASAALHDFGSVLVARVTARAPVASIDHVRAEIKRHHARSGDPVTADALGCRVVVGEGRAALAEIVVACWPAAGVPVLTAADEVRVRYLAPPVPRIDTVLPATELLRRELQDNRR